MVILAVVIGVLLTIADQLLKLWAITSLKPIGSITVIEKVFSLTYVENRGAAWGIFAGASWYLIAMPIVIIAAIIIFLVVKKSRDPLLIWPAALIISGGVGNLIDRVFRGFVVDFLQVTFIDFPVFNLADCCITIGGALVILYVLLSDLKQRKAGGDKHAG